MSQRIRENEPSTEARSWRSAEVDGRTVGFWIVVAVTIAVVVLGLGAWWVWGLGRGMPTDDDGGMNRAMAGDEDVSPPRTVVLVTWHDEDAARELPSADEVEAAADDGEIELEETDTVVNLPMLTWPRGER